MAKSDKYLQSIAGLFFDGSDALFEKSFGRQEFIDEFLRPIFNTGSPSIETTRAAGLLDSADPDVIPEFRRSIVAAARNRSAGAPVPSGFSQMLDSYEAIDASGKFNSVIEGIDEDVLSSSTIKPEPKPRQPPRKRGTTYRRSNVDFTPFGGSGDFSVTDDFLDDFERKSARSISTDPTLNPRGIRGGADLPGGFRSGPTLGVGASDLDKQVFDLVDELDPSATPLARTRAERKAAAAAKSGAVQGPAPDMGPKPLGKRMPAKLSKFAKVAGPIGAALMLYDILSTYGDVSTSGARQNKKMLEGAGAPMQELFTASSRNELNESSALRDIAEAGKVSPTRPSLELQGILGAQEGMLSDLRQKVKPTMTEAYARAGLL